jgi:hypothetical protein
MTTKCPCHFLLFAAALAAFGLAPCPVAADITILETSSTRMLAETSAGRGDYFDWDRDEIDASFSGPGTIGRTAGPVSATALDSSASSGAAAGFNAILGPTRIQTDGYVDVAGQGGYASGLADSLNRIRFTIDAAAPYELRSWMSQSVGVSGLGQAFFVFGGATRLLDSGGGAIWERAMSPTPLTQDLGWQTDFVTLTAGEYNLETVYRVEGAADGNGSYTGRQDYSLQLVQTPEPGTLALLLAGVLLAAVKAARRRAPLK